MNNIEKVLIYPEATIRDVIQCIDKNYKGIALIVDREHHLLGTVTDGDIRRFILAGRPLESQIKELLTQKLDTNYPQPITALITASQTALLKLMQKHVIQQIPIIDEANRVVDLITWDMLLPEKELSVQALIMAGGFGSRLKPLTDELPKPMLPVGGRPLLEHIIEQLKNAGIQKINIATHYMPEKIVTHFGDGKPFGVQINYIHEEKPLGTGGALGLIPTPREPLLVINGDILTQVNFRAMLSYHHEHHAVMTMAVRQYDIQIPYGVMECEDVQIQKIVEKPQLRFLVNAGIYLVGPDAFKFITEGDRFNITDLIEWLLDADLMVVGFPIHEYWLDIGQHDDYLQAQNDILQ